MNARLGRDPLERRSNLSEALYGEASEMSVEEAIDLLDAGGLDSRILKANLHRRALELQKQYEQEGQNPPRVLEEMIGELVSPTAANQSEGAWSVEKRWILRLLSEIRQLPQLLHTGFEPSFSYCYRNKKELSDTDKAILDRVAEGMKNNLKDSL